MWIYACMACTAYPKRDRKPIPAHARHQIHTALPSPSIESGFGHGSRVWCVSRSIYVAEYSCLVFPLLKSFRDGYGSLPAVLASRSDAWISANERGIHASSAEHSLAQRLEMRHQRCRTRPDASSSATDSIYSRELLD